MTKPQIILADEPTANLDIKTGTKVLEIMKRINEREKTLFVFSTHDPKVMEMATRNIHIRDGMISKYSHYDRRLSFENENYSGDDRMTEGLYLKEDL